MDAALVKKLALKPGYRVLVINAPEGYLDRITPLPEGSMTVSGGPADWVQVFVRNKADVDALAPGALAAATREAVVWICYPKGGPKVTDINRDKGWDAVYGAGYGPVAQVAIDEAWSALRWRPEADIDRKGTTFKR